MSPRAPSGWCSLQTLATRTEKPASNSSRFVRGWFHFVCTVQVGGNHPSGPPPVVVSADAAGVCDGLNPRMPPLFCRIRRPPILFRSDACHVNLVVESCTHERE